MDRYADFFEYYSKTQECNRWWQILESRVTKYNENFYPNEENFEGTVYDFINT